MKITAQHRILDEVWCLAVAGVIIGSLVPLSGPVPGPEAADKAVHFMAYAFITVIPGLRLARGWPLGGAAAFALSLGLILEFAQRFVPGRSFDLHDLAANSAGVAAGLAVSLIIPRGSIHGRCQSNN